MGTLGIQSCIVINLISFGATLYFSFRLRNLNELIEREFGVPHSPKVSFQGMVNDFKDSIRFVWETPLFRPFIFLMFFLNLSSLMPNAPSFTYYFREMENYSSAGYGMALSVFALLGVVGYFCSPWLYRRLPFHTVFAASGLLFAVFATSSIIFVPTPLVLIAVFSLSRASSAILTMGTYLIRQTRIPKSRMGGANACIRMFFMAGAPLSALLQAYLIAHYGVRISFIMGAVCLWAAYQSARLVSKAYESTSPELAASPRAA